MLPIKQEQEWKWQCDGKSPGGGALPYMSYIDMCHCEGYGFQAV